MDSAVTVRSAELADAEWVFVQLKNEFHGPMVERGDELIDASGLPALIADVDGSRVGVLTYIVHGDHVEIFTLSTTLENRGVGTSLITAAEDVARAAGLSEMRLFVINSNLHALGFYQRRGYRVWSVHRDTITRARLKWKPEIPLVDDNGIVIADELELRKTLV